MRTAATRFAERLWRPLVTLADAKVRSCSTLTRPFRNAERFLPGCSRAGRVTENPLRDAWISWLSRARPAGQCRHGPRRRPGGLCRGRPGQPAGARLAAARRRPASTAAGSSSTTCSIGTSTGPNGPNGRFRAAVSPRGPQPALARACSPSGSLPPRWQPPGRRWWPPRRRHPSSSTTPGASARGCSDP